VPLPAIIFLRLDVRFDIYGVKKGQENGCFEEASVIKRLSSLEKQPVELITRAKNLARQEKVSLWSIESGFCLHETPAKSRPHLWLD